MKGRNTLRAAWLASFKGQTGGSMPMIPHRGPYPTFGTMAELKILDTLMGMELDEISDSLNQDFTPWTESEVELLRQMHEKVKHAQNCHPSFRDPSP